MVLRVSIVEEVIISCSSSCPAAPVGGREGLPMTPLGGRFEEGEPRLLLSLKNSFVTLFYPTISFFICVKGGVINPLQFVRL